MRRERAEKRGEREFNPNSRILFAAVRDAKAQATERAWTHLQKNGNAWFDRKYNSLLKAFGVSNEEAPGWATRDLKEIACKLAASAVVNKHENRISRINSACFRMSLTGRLRKSRMRTKGIELGD